MPYCSPAEVKSAINFPDEDAPVSDCDINRFILDSEEEIESIYKTKFGNVEVDSTATSATSSTITDTTKEWVDNQYENYVVWVYSGTGSGQYAEIISNTSTELTVSPAFTTTPDNTSKYKITKLGFKNEVADGTGTSTYFVKYQPLTKLNALTISSTNITASSVYQYNESGKLMLSSTSEYTTFLNNEPQSISLKYAYGVYPMPRIIKRLCIILAGMRTLTAQIAGTYDDFTSFSLPAGVSGSKGEPYTNIQNALSKLQMEAKGIIYGDPSNAVGSDFRNLPSFRPFTLFG